MITIQGIEIDFDMTSPSDLSRLEEAKKKAAEREANVVEPPQDVSSDTYLQEYIEWLNGVLNSFGNFIDDLFGDGIAEKLLTNNPSLTKMLDINDALEDALGGHAKQITERFSKFKPNRATRRSKT